jgi:hypothetical protein
VHDRVRCSSTGTKAVEILEAAALHRDARRNEGRRGGFGSRETGDGVAGGPELLDDCGTHPAGGAGNENTHDDDFL